MQEKWEDFAPGFHDWFSRTQATQFLDSVIESARDGTGIDGLFYNNGIESLHSILKEEVEGKRVSLPELLSSVKTVINRQQTEEIRAMYQAGKYRLAKEYKHFQVHMKAKF